MTDPVMDRPGPRRLLFTGQDDFWMDDLRRMTSPESDYGVMWRRDLQWREHPEWRVSYVRDTGEVYAGQQKYHGQIRILGVVPADPVPDGSRDTYYRTVDRVLEGWQDPGISGFLLKWVIMRLAAAGALVPCASQCPLPYYPGGPVPCEASGRCARPNPAWLDGRCEGSWCNQCARSGGCLYGTRDETTGR